MCFNLQTSFAQMEYQQSPFVADKALSFVVRRTAVISPRMKLRKDANASRRGDGAEQLAFFGEEAHARRSGRSS